MTEIQRIANRLTRKQRATLLCLDDKPIGLGLGARYATRLSREYPNRPALVVTHPLTYMAVYPEFSLTEVGMLVRLQLLTEAADD